MRFSWKKVRYRGEALVVHGLARMIPALPRPVCQFVAAVVGTIAAHVHLPGRRVALENIELAFGPALSPSARRKLVRQSYRHFARAMADLFWSPRLTSENIAQFIDLSQLARLKERAGAADQRCAVFACLHYGGFEWIAPALGLTGVDCTIVTQAFKNPLLNRTFNRLREVTGQQTIRREGAMLRLYKALQNQRSVILAVDLTVSAKLPSVPITCFGMETCVTFAHAWLHDRTTAPIIPTYCEPLPGGRYRLVFQPALQVPPGATHQQIAQACWDGFEPVIRSNPAPWLWMYKHWRYRPADSPQRYPDYANESPHFRKLLARVRKAKPAAHGPAVAISDPGQMAPLD